MRTDQYWLRVAPGQIWTMHETRKGTDPQIYGFVMERTPKVGGIDSAAKHRGISALHRIS